MSPDAGTTWMYSLPDRLAACLNIVGGLAGFWANPGGGVEPGGSRLQALQRELREEVGLAITTLGEEVWTKTAIFPMPGWDGQTRQGPEAMRDRRTEARVVAHTTPGPGASADASSLDQGLGVARPSART